MTAFQQLLTKHIDIWTAAETEKKSGRGRASGSGSSVYGIKKLRELILDLAVRGKLVPQDKYDEPASELLKKIQTEKTKLIIERRIKKEKAIAPIVDEDLPFALPQGWDWVRLGEITNFGTTVKMDCLDSNVWILDLEDIEKDTSKLLQKVRFSERNSLSDKNSFRKGDVLYGKLRPYLNKVIVADEDGVCTTEILPIRCYGKFSGNYFKTALKSPYFLSYVNTRSYGMKMPRLGTEDGRQAPFPLPPLAEQHRIVAKVDELMALCDQLEDQHSDAADAHEQLVSHLLGTLTQSQSAEDFNTNWQRISAHFDTLFTTEASIDALKQTLLQLAVMGKLVAQDANDEPAIELLNHVSIEKNKLIASGLEKKGKSLPLITENEKLFSLPAGWEFSRKAAIFNFLNGYAFKSEWFQPTGVKLLRNVNISHGKANWNDTARISETHASEFNLFRLNVGDIVLSLDRPIITTGLKYSVISEDDIPCLLLQRVAKISSYAEVVSPGYLPIWLNSLFFLKNIDPGRSNGVPHISTTQLSNMVFALPPIKEQRRIVAKIDELMEICNQLRTSITSINQQQKKLADALVEQVVAT